MNRNYEDLANAIIVQATIDYPVFYKALQKHKNINTAGFDETQKKRYDKRLAKLQADFDKVRNFFGSPYYYTLTSVNHRLILDKLEKEVLI